jgi:hypothetical protein
VYTCTECRAHAELSGAPRTCVSTEAAKH